LLGYCKDLALPAFRLSNKTIITDESIKEKPKEEVDPQQYQTLSQQVENDWLWIVYTCYF
jgi:hypothetical protein